MDPSAFDTLVRSIARVRHPASAAGGRCRCSAPSPWWARTRPPPSARSIGCSSAPRSATGSSATTRTTTNNNNDDKDNNKNKRRRWGRRGGTERDLHLLSRHAGLLCGRQRLLLSRAGALRRRLLSPRQHLQQQSGATGLLPAPLPGRRLLSVRQCRQLPAVCRPCGADPPASEVRDVLPHGAGLHAERMPPLARVMHA